jgi:Holliday junction resolvase
VAEQAIVDAIGRHLTKRGAWWIKTHGTTHGRRGIPDIIATYRAQPIAIEAKTPHGRLSRLQRHELERARRAGAITIIARDVPTVARILDTIDQHHPTTTDPQPRPESEDG